MAKLNTLINFAKVMQSKVLFCDFDPFEPRGDYFFLEVEGDKHTEPIFVNYYRKRDVYYFCSDKRSIIIEDFPLYKMFLTKRTLKKIKDEMTIKDEKFREKIDNLYYYTLYDIEYLSFQHFFDIFDIKEVDGKRVITFKEDI